jgi:ABC-2 type transport system ATP-binding protein
MTSAITLDRVCKSYRGLRVLDHVSFDVPAGVVYAVLGENGAGKTTSIKTMLGLVRPDSGSARVLGLDSRREDLEIRRRVGYVAEQPQLFPWMTVDEIGWFAAGFYPEGYFAEFVRQVQAFKVPREQRIERLSKGTRAKVALALAMSHDPDLLILDEPTSGLDPLVRREFLQAMIDRAADGKTVFLASHQIAEVERVADCVALLHDGRLVLAGRLDELKQQLAQLTVQVREPLVPVPDLNGRVVASFRKGRQWQALVRDFSDDQRAFLAGHDFVDQFESRIPTLEEIYVAHMAQVGQDSGAQNDAGDVT